MPASEALKEGSDWLQEPEGRLRQLHQALPVKVQRLPTALASLHERPRVSLTAPEKPPGPRGPGTPAGGGEACTPDSHCFCTTRATLQHVHTTTPQEMGRHAWGGPGEVLSTSKGSRRGSRSHLDRPALPVRTGPARPNVLLLLGNRPRSRKPVRMKATRPLILSCLQHLHTGALLRLSSERTSEPEHLCAYVLLHFIGRHLTSIHQQRQTISGLKTFK